MDGETGGAGAVLRAREVLETVTPLLRDCGGLCGSACCQPDSGGRGGMLLFPGEEALYDPLPEGFDIQPDREMHGALLLTCRGVCERARRPLACRVFPLAFGERDGCPDAALDPRAWPVCPLMPSGMEGLSERFVKAARRAAEILWEDPDQRSFIIRQQAVIRRFTAAPWRDGGSL